MQNTIHYKHLLRDTKEESGYLVEDRSLFISWVQGYMLILSFYTRSTQDLLCSQPYPSLKASSAYIPVERIRTYSMIYRQEDIGIFVA